MIYYRKYHNLDAHMPTRHTKQDDIYELPTLWFNDLIYRPTERQALRNVMFSNLSNDSTERHRRYCLDFNSVDWQLYLLMSYLAGKVFFGNDDKSLKRESETLKKCSDIMQCTTYEIITYHAELCTKIQRRRLHNLAEIPSQPIGELAKHKSLIRRIQLAGLEQIRA